MDIVTTTQAYKELGISRRKLYYLMKQQRIEYIELPGMGRVIKREVLDAFIKQNDKGTAAHVEPR